MKQVLLPAMAVFLSGFQMTDVPQEPLPLIERMKQSYLGIKNALVEGHPVEAGTAAGKLIVEAATADKKAMSAKLARAWQAHSGELKRMAGKISKTLDIKVQREHFMNLSDAMYALLKADNSNTGTLYYDFCPMANGGKGAYWISETTMIRNPYYGKAMLSCGSVKETITDNGKPDNILIR